MSTPPISAAADAAPIPAWTEDGVHEVAGQPFTSLQMGAAIAIGVIALLVSGLMGLLLGALAQEGRLSPAGIGLTATLEALSTGLVTGLAGIVLKPRGLRGIGAVAAMGLVLVNLATLGRSGEGVMLMRALAGLPEGLLLWIAIGLISRTETPARWAGVLFTGMGVSQLAFAAGLSAFALPRFGAGSGYVALAAAAVVAIPLALFLPRSLGAVPGAEGHGGGAPPFRGWLALFGTLCYSASPSAVGVYVLPLADEAGLSQATGRMAISVSLACQIAGGALATVLANRARWIAVFWGCSLVFFATWAVYAIRAPAWLFVGISGLAGLCGMLAGPFLVPMTIEADPSRRAAMQSGAVQLLAGALGPLMSSMVVDGRHVHAVLALGAVLLSGGLAIVTALHRMTSR